MLKFAVTLFLITGCLVGGAVGEEAWVVESKKGWRRATESARNMVVKQRSLSLHHAGEGQWVSRWYDAAEFPEPADLLVETRLSLFTDKTIETLVDGSKKPYTDADGVKHDWYGRCMIAIVDENRWIMAFRSFTGHITWGRRDTIHLITSTDEGRTWSKLNHWFDGMPIEGMPYEDGHHHSEPGLYKMPNGDLILQFWNVGYTAGTKQLRSTDNGKTWTEDIDQIEVQGVTGAEDDMAIGTQGYFVDPENPGDVYMAFQYFYYNSQAGTLLARTQDNGKSYEFLSWMSPLTVQGTRRGMPTFEPAIAYVGNRTIVAVMRGTDNRHTWQAVSTDMGRSFGPMREISNQIDGGVPDGLWQRARLYKESNPYFWYDNPLDYASGEGRLWGFGLHSVGGDFTRKPVVYWSDDNGDTWYGPELLHGSMHPGTDTGYGDLKRRQDGTYVATTYYCPYPRDSSEADVELYTFNAPRAEARLELDQDDDGESDDPPAWRELYNGVAEFRLPENNSSRWRLNVVFKSSTAGGSPKIRRLRLLPRQETTTQREDE